MSKTYISVVNGRNRKPRHGMMNEPKAASIITGRASQTHSNMMRENDETTAVKQPD